SRRSLVTGRRRAPPVRRRAQAPPPARLDRASASVSNLDGLGRRSPFPRLGPCGLGPGGGASTVFQRRTSLPLFESSGSVQDARLKQQGRRFPPCILEMLTSTRRLRVAGFLVALIHRTHSHRAIGVIARQRSWTSRGALDRASRRSGG